MPDEAATASFAIRGEASPQLVARIAGLVAQLGLTPLMVSMCRAGGEAFVQIVQDGLDPHRAHVLAEKMRALVPVRSVDLNLARADPEEAP